MRRNTLLAVALGTALATAAVAEPTPPGINIRWNDCFSDGGDQNKSFACDTNAGSELAVLSLQLDTPMSQVSGVEIRITFKAAAGQVPAWWEFLEAQSCRRLGLSYVTSPQLAGGNCPDWGLGFQAGAFVGYHPGEGGPETAVGHIVAAVPQQTLMTLDPGIEYTVGALRLNHTQSAGAGSCAGCDVPMCILFSALKVTTSNPPAADRLFTQGANGESSQIIHWQNGRLANLVNHCTSPIDCVTAFDCINTSSTPTRQSTWGAVKALYR